MRWGRPDIGRYADRFDVPPARGTFKVTFLGVASLLVDDGETALMTDGFFTRPSLPRVALGRIAPDRARVTSCLRQAGVQRLAAVVPVHTHFDHALDSALVAQLTGAALVGGESAANVGRGAGLAEERIRVVTPGEPMSYGGFTVTMLASHHCPPDRFPGVITEPLVPPTRARDYRCGEAWSVLLGHRGGRTALVQGSAGYVPGLLSGHRAEVVYLGVGQLGVQDEGYLRSYWDETVRTVGARRVVLVHWDDFFRPLDRNLRALPYLGDDLHATMRGVDELARRDGVLVSLPRVWRREDPWA